MSEETKSNELMNLSKVELMKQAKAMGLEIQGKETKDNIIKRMLTKEREMKANVQKKDRLLQKPESDVQENKDQTQKAVGEGDSQFINRLIRQLASSQTSGDQLEILLQKLELMFNDLVHGKLVGKLKQTDNYTFAKSYLDMEIQPLKMEIQPLKNIVDWIKNLVITIQDKQITLNDDMLEVKDELNQIVMEKWRELTASINDHQKTNDKSIAHVQQVLTDLITVKENKLSGLITSLEGKLNTNAADLLKLDKRLSSAVEKVNQGLNKKMDDAVNKASSALSASMQKEREQSETDLEGLKSEITSKIVQLREDISEQLAQREKSASTTHSRISRQQTASSHVLHAVQADFLAHMCLQLERDCLNDFHFKAKAVEIESLPKGEQLRLQSIIRALSSLKNFDHTVSLKVNSFAPEEERIQERMTSFQDYLTANGVDHEWLSIEMSTDKETLKRLRTSKEKMDWITITPVFEVIEE